MPDQDIETLVGIVYQKKMAYDKALDRWSRLACNDVRHYAPGEYRRETWEADATVDKLRKELEEAEQKLARAEQEQKRDSEGATGQPGAERPVHTTQQIDTDPVSSPVADEQTPTVEIEVSTPTPEPDRVTTENAAAAHTDTDTVSSQVADEQTPTVEIEVSTPTPEPDRVTTENAAAAHTDTDTVSSQVADEQT